MRSGVQPRSQAAKDAKAVFILGAVFMCVGAISLVLGLNDTVSNLSYCLNGAGRNGPPFLRIASALYWVSFVSGCTYVAMFLAWWARRGRPWREINDIAFSRIAWAGRRAWDDSLLKVLRSFGSPDVGPHRRLVLMWHVALATATTTSSGILLYILLTCDRCPSTWSGTCIGSAAGAAASAFLLVIYYDLRIKFRSSH